MSRSQLLRRALLLATLIAAGGGLIVQCAVTIGVVKEQGRSPFAAIWLVLRFFTILTNILVVAVTIAALRDDKRGSFLARASTQSAVALHIAVVGIVYSLLLRAIWNPQGWQYVADRLLHDSSPVLFVLYWLLAVPKGALRFGQIPVWLIYPLAYLVYALARGAAEGAYAYPFLDVAALGTATVARNALLMLALFAALGGAIVAIDRALARRISAG